MILKGKRSIEDLIFIVNIQHADGGMMFDNLKKETKAFFIFFLNKQDAFQMG